MILDLLVMVLPIWLVLALLCVQLWTFSCSLIPPASIATHFIIILELNFKATPVCALLKKPGVTH